MKKFIIYYIPLIIVFLSIENVSSQKLATPQTDYLKQGIANLKEENYEEAVEDLKKARRDVSDSSAAAYFLGIAYKKIQNYREAKVQLKDAITLKPAVKEAVLELADVLYQLGEFDEALKNLEIAEKKNIEPAQTSFLKGLILLKLGKNIEAINSFEKAKSIDDKLIVSANYQIAVAKLQEGKLIEAKDILKEIVVKDPNADIAQFANQYIDAITKRLKEERPFGLNIGMQAQYDDNVILKPSDVSAAAGITGEHDTVEVFSLRAKYTPKFKGAYGLGTQYSLYLNNHEKLATYNVQSHTAALIPSYNFKNSSINLNLSFNYTLVNNNEYLRTVTASPTYTLLTGENHFLQVSLRYLRKEYLKPPLSPDEDRNGTDSGGGLSWFYMIAENKGFFNARYEFNREDTSGVNWKYNGNKIGLSILYPLTENLKFNVGGEVYGQIYTDIHTAFRKRREDRTYTFNTMFSYRVYDDIDFQMQYMYSREDSNIAVYAYEKNVVSGGLEVNF